MEKKTFELFRHVYEFNIPTQQWSMQVIRQEEEEKAAMEIATAELNRIMKNSKNFG